jgi:hypothetical protein
MRDAELFVRPLGLILVVVQWLFREAASGTFGSRIIQQLLWINSTEANLTSVLRRC